MGSITDGVIGIILPVALWLATNSTSYEIISLMCKDGQCVVLSKLSHSHACCHEI